MMDTVWTVLTFIAYGALVVLLIGLAAEGWEWWQKRRVTRPGDGSAVEQARELAMNLDWDELSVERLDRNHADEEPRRVNSPASSGRPPSGMPSPAST